MTFAVALSFVFILKRAFWSHYKRTKIYSILITIIIHRSRCQSISEAFSPFRAFGYFLLRHVSIQEFWCKCPVPWRLECPAQNILSCPWHPDSWFQCPDFYEQDVLSWPKHPSVLTNRWIFGKSQLPLSSCYFLW